ncbi:MAG: hypothetical protein ACI88S_001939, partial [Ilumatobacter sp.]
PNHYQTEPLPNRTFGICGWPFSADGPSNPKDAVIQSASVDEPLV